MIPQDLHSARTPNPDPAPSRASQANTAPRFRTEEVLIGLNR